MLDEDNFFFKIMWFCGQWTHIDMGFLCRRHPSPTKEMLEPLLHTTAAVGLNLDVSSSKALADSLDHAVVRLLRYCISVYCYSGYCHFWAIYLYQL